MSQRSHPSRRAILSSAAIGLASSALPAAAVSSQEAPGDHDQRGQYGLSARTFGAIGDGLEHPLSERYATLEAAQRVYPQARALSDLIDGLAIQAALDHATLNRGRVYLPAGRYRGNTMPLRLPNFVELVGDGPGISIIDNQNTRVATPLIVNKDPDNFVAWAVRDLSLHGGSHGMKIDVALEVSGWALENVSFELQTQCNFACNKLLQYGRIEGVSFATAPFGLVVTEPTTNLVDLYGVSFANHSRSSLKLRSAEAFMMWGGRFEQRAGAEPIRVNGSIRGNVLTVARGSGPLEAGLVLVGPGVVPGTRIAGALPGPGGAYRVDIAQTMPAGDLVATWPVIDLDNVGAVSFEGVYFENTHKLLLLETSSRNSVAFQNCHFTGSAFTGPRDWEEFEFVSDGWVAFAGNDPNLPMRGPQKIIATGFNNDRIGGGNQIRYPGTPESGHLVAATRPFGAVMELITFTRPGGGSARPNDQILTGELTVNYVGRDRDGGARFCSRRYHVCVCAAGAAPLTATLDLLGGRSGSADLAIVPRVQAGASRDRLVVEAVSENGGADPQSAFRWEFRWLSALLGDGPALAVTLPAPSAGQPL